MTRARRLLGLAAALCCLSAPVAAQTVVIRVMDGEAGRPVFGALSYLVGETGQTVKNALTDERGRALFLGIPAGTYRVRVEMIGMATAETELFDVASGTTISRDIRLTSRAIRLEGIDVELEAGRCEVRPGGEGLLVAQVWDEARKALSAAAFTEQRGTYRYRTMTYNRRLHRDTRLILSEEQSERQGYMRTPFESRPAEDLVENGFVQPDGAEYLYFAPDAAVLLSDPFLDTHCFKIVDMGRGPEGLLGLGFEPTGEDKNVVDIAGVMWLDPETIELQWLEFRYEYLEVELSSSDVGGRVVFRRMPDGTWIVPEWWIRMAVLGYQTDFEGFRRSYIAQYHQTGGRVLEVREAGGRSLGQRVQTGGVEGIVTDSIGVPLAGVRVGVIGSNQEVFSNADGHYAITGLTEGRYQVRFVDPNLEAIGFIPEPVIRDVIRGEISSFDYHMPSIGDVLFEACRDEEVPERSVILAGLVRDGRGRAAAGAAVRVQWSEFRTNAGTGLTTVQIAEISDGLDVTASATGFFRFCGVPDGERLTLQASLGDMQSDPMEMFLSLLDGATLTVIQLPTRR